MLVQFAFYDYWIVLYYVQNVKYIILSDACRSITVAIVVAVVIRVFQQNIKATDPSEPLPNMEIHKLIQLHNQFKTWFPLNYKLCLESYNWIYVHIFWAYPAAVAYCTRYDCRTSEHRLVWRTIVPRSDGSAITIAAQGANKGCKMTMYTVCKWHDALRLRCTGTTQFSNVRNVLYYVDYDWFARSVVIRRCGQAVIAKQQGSSCTQSEIKIRAKVCRVSYITTFHCSRFCLSIYRLANGESAVRTRNWNRGSHAVVAYRTSLMRVWTLNGVW